MSKLEYPLPTYMAQLWARILLMRHQVTVAGDGCPREYLQAVGRYTNDKITFRSEIWQHLQKWRQYVKRNPKAVPLVPSPPHPLCDDCEFAAYFEELILAAVFYGQEDILQALSEVASLAQAPEPDMHAVRAVIAAFSDLFKGDGGENDWPLKKQVRERAIEIFKETGLRIPETSSEWARLFRKAGLSKLREARKSKASGRDRVTFR